MTRTDHEPSTDPTPRSRRPFDLRHAIAALFGIYGTALVVLGLGGASPDELHKSGGWNVNLWCGLAMLAFAALCAGWARWRPLPAPQQQAPEETAPGLSSRTEAAGTPAGSSG
ncbi:hypothetical protein ACFWN5_16030 [Streptomyces sp. NPDC058430]|uniref:hypothetical protein n=1 Tax=Streptomyces sp. NPDC058430 TaxID=3346495 RepID=UPI003668FD12